MKYILFGTGNYYQRYRNWFLNEESVVLMDNSKEKQNTIIDGFQVLSPEEAIQNPYDAIIILSFFVDEMKRQLLALGVEESKIFHFYDIYTLFGANRVKNAMVKYKSCIKKIVEVRDNRKILLLSHDCELTGPGIALYKVASLLHKYGYNVTFGSMIDGPLREKILAEGIDVIVDCNLQASTMMEIEWTNQYDLIFCNTLNYHIFLMKHNLDIPIIWWLHDPAFFYEGVRKENFDKINIKNIFIYTVGDIARDALKHYMPNAKMQELLYGVEELQKKANQMPKSQNTKIRFLVIGYINAIKGQDILCKAVDLLSNQDVEKIEFVFVGDKSSGMAQELEKKYEKIRNISFMGIVGREKVHQLLETADVLVCPSRLDAMPTVCAEAMMHRVPCLISDATGMVKYITPFVDGLVFGTEDVEDLKKKLIWCIQNKDKLKKMGFEARKIYEKYFSSQVFEKNILKVIEEATEDTKAGCK